MEIRSYWQAVLAQRPEEMRSFLHPDAVVRWPNTNEQFTADEFIQANCTYPGSWNGVLERVEEAAGRVITVVRVYARDQSASFHVTSFMKLQDDKILELDEYWGDDGPPPRWRQSMHLGKPLKPSGNLPLLL